MHKRKRDIFDDWLASARPGADIEYYRGDLAYDRGGWGTRKPAVPWLSALADRAWTLAQDGHVHLVQHRRGQSDYSYLAVATRHGIAAAQPAATPRARRAA